MRVYDEGGDVIKSRVPAETEKKAPVDIIGEILNLMNLMTNH